MDDFNKREVIRYKCDVCGCMEYLCKDMTPQPTMPCLNCGGTLRKWKSPAASPDEVAEMKRKAEEECTQQ